MSHWAIKPTDRFITRDGTVVRVAAEFDGYYKMTNDFWYDGDSGRDGWTVMGVDSPHGQDLREKIK